MPRGPEPLGERAMTHAERQARYRAAQAADTPAVKVRYRKPTDRRSRPQRWRDAVAELLELQADYQQWLDALPESLADTPMADALRAICDLTCPAWRLTHHAVSDGTRGLQGHRCRE